MQSMSARGVGGGGGGSVAGGGANDGLGTGFNGLGDGHRHAAILERPGRVEPLVFDEDVAAAPDHRAQFGRMDEGRVAFVEGDHGGGVRDGQVLAVAGDQAPVVEELGCGHRGCLKN
jgi:hypothetical protein